MCQQGPGIITQAVRDTYAAEDAAPVPSLGTACPGRFRLAGGAEGYRTARARLLPDGVSLNFSKHTEICTCGEEPVFETQTACVTPAHAALQGSCGRSVPRSAIGMASPWPKGHGG